MNCVIIPTYDNLKGLKKLVKNIKLPIYVIEDGQKKETIAWLKKQKFKTVYHKENKGVAVSWNDGVKQAMNDGFTRFVIINDDVELPKNWEECLDNKAHIISLKGWGNLANTNQTIVLTGWFFVIDKYVVDKVGLFDETLSKFTAEDTDYAIRCFNVGLRPFLTDIEVKHEGSGTLNKIKIANPVYFKETLNQARINLKNKHKNIRMYAQT